METGIYTLQTLPWLQLLAKPFSQQPIRNLMEEIELSDQVGLDVFALGEHPRLTMLFRLRAKRRNEPRGSNYPVQVPCKLGRSRTVFQAFANVDLLSGGRAAIMDGRVSFIELLRSTVD